MKTFSGKVAVITGAASGIGRAMAGSAGMRGMKLVLADIEEPALEKAAEELRADGVEVLAVHTDVSNPADMEALAEKTLKAFSEVHLLVNNAGIGAGSTVWESTLADWQWVMGVNLWGVIHGCRIFLPIMLRQGVEGHIVNTASIAGLIDGHPVAPYQVTKHAVVALSEHIYFSLVQMQSPVGVSVLCPGWVRTRILEGERNRPLALQNPSRTTPAGPEEMQIFQAMQQALEAGIMPDQVAEVVFESIESGRFYILPHDEYDSAVRSRMENILERKNPEVSKRY